MNNRQIIDAMHERILPKGHGVSEDSSKILLAAEFPRWHAHFKEFARDRLDLMLTPEDKENFRAIVDNATELRRLHQDLIDATRHIFHEPCAGYLQFMTAQAKRSETVDQFKAFNRLHWERLQIIHPDHPQEIDQRLENYSEAQRHRHAMLEIVGGGIGNIVWFSWALICVGGKALLRDTGETPSVTEWDTVAKSTLSLMIDIASAERHVFDHGIVPKLSRACDRAGLDTSRDSDHFNWPTFDESLFYVENGELMLDPKVIEIVHKEVERQVAQGLIVIDSTRTGCPGKIFFPRIHEWCLQAAREFIFPRAEHVLKLQ